MPPTGSQQTLGHRGWEGRPLYGIRKTLRVGAERLSEPGWTRLRVGLGRDDPADEVLEAWLAKEAVQAVYGTDDHDEAAVRLEAAMATCLDSEVPELATLLKTLRRCATRSWLTTAPVPPTDRPRPSTWR